MNRSFSYNHNKSILYLVATPIGNLDDFTFRAVKTLNSVDCIFAEDTRNSKVLLNHYDIKTKLESYHEFSDEKKENEIISRLLNGENIAIISDAGNPVISDPGFNLVRLAVQNDIPVSVIPGPCAYITALVASGLPTMPHTFNGFLDSKKTKRVEQLKRIKNDPSTHIFYESPHRILETLKDVYDVLGDVSIVIARELTKKFEEFIRGKVSSIIDKLDSIKGEIVLLISPLIQEDNSNINYIDKVNELISKGYKSIDAIKEIAIIYNINKKELYSMYVKSI
ncbi:MAG: 16S rRNA (cytidine(1402)-2'-O)-methyltransferase [Anaeroplasmataceae bacterium]